MYISVGRLYNDSRIEIISDGNKFFAIDGWNGLQYCNCWEVSDEIGQDPIVDPIGSCKYHFGSLEYEFDEGYYTTFGYEKNIETTIVLKDELDKYVKKAKKIALRIDNKLKYPHISKPYIESELDMINFLLK